MNKDQPGTAPSKIAINVEFEEPLRTLLLRQCAAEERTMAGMLRIICKRYFAEQGALTADSHPRPTGDRPGEIPYYPDELPAPRRDVAD